MAPMLMPKRVKHRKEQRGRMRGLAKGGQKLSFGEYGLQAVEPGWITSIKIIGCGFYFLPASRLPIPRPNRLLMW